MNSKPFIIPKAPANQLKFNELSSLLSMQPKNIQNFDDIQKITCNSDDLIKYVSSVVKNTIKSSQLTTIKIK